MNDQLCLGVTCDVLSSVLMSGYSEWPTVSVSDVWCTFIYANVWIQWMINGVWEWHVMYFHLSYWLDTVNDQLCLGVTCDVLSSVLMSGYSEWPTVSVSDLWCTFIYANVWIQWMINGVWEWHVMYFHLSYWLDTVNDQMCLGVTCDVLSSVLLAGYSEWPTVSGSDMWCTFICPIGWKQWMTNCVWEWHVMYFHLS
jgi:hypothetical protein